MRDCQTGRFGGIKCHVANSTAARCGKPCDALHEIDRAPRRLERHLKTAEAELESCYRRRISPIGWRTVPEVVFKLPEAHRKRMHVHRETGPAGTQATNLQGQRVVADCIRRPEKCAYRTPSLTSSGNNPMTESFKASSGHGREATHVAHVRGGNLCAGHAGHLHLRTKIFVAQAPAALCQ